MLNYLLELNMIKLIFVPFTLLNLINLIRILDLESDYFVDFTLLNLTLDSGFRLGH